MRPTAFVIAALFLPAAVAAQEAPIEVGERVRFWTQQRRTVTSGTITEWAVDSFTVSDTWIPLTSVTRLEVHRGQKTSASTVALATGIGAGSGAVMTAGLVCGVESALAGRFFCQGLNERLTREITFLGWIAIGAGAGALVGALVGATRKTERWEEVPLDRLRVSFGPQTVGRFSLGVAVTY